VARPPDLNACHSVGAALAAVILHGEVDQQSEHMWTLRGLQHLNMTASRGSPSTHTFCQMLHRGL